MGRVQQSYRIHIASQFHCTHCPGQLGIKLEWHPQGAWSALLLLLLQDLACLEGVPLCAAVCLQTGCPTSVRALAPAAHHQLHVLLPELNQLHLLLIQCTLEPDDLQHTNTAAMCRTAVVCRPAVVLPAWCITTYIFSTCYVQAWPLYTEQASSACYAALGLGMGDGLQDSRCMLASTAAVLQYGTTWAKQSASALCSPHPACPLSPVHLQAH